MSYTFPGGMAGIVIYKLTMCHTPFQEAWPTLWRARDGSTAQENARLPPCLSLRGWPQCVAMRPPTACHTTWVGEKIRTCMHNSIASASC